LNIFAVINSEELDNCDDAAGEAALHRPLGGSETVHNFNSPNVIVICVLCSYLIYATHFNISGKGKSCGVTILKGHKIHKMPGRVVLANILIMNLYWKHARQQSL
jgi:hypothetical protein